MRKVFVLVLVSLIVLLTMPLMFTSVASASVCCECTGNKWAQAASWPTCNSQCGYLGEEYTGTYYKPRSGTTCGADCSNAASTCGANPNLGYVWGIGKRCYDAWLWDSIYTCAQTSTSGSTAFTCTQSWVKCGELGSGIECKPNVGTSSGPPEAGSACQACPGGGSSAGSPCPDATCCLGVDPDCCSVCVDKDSDPNNCGSCGNACGEDYWDCYDDTTRAKYHCSCVGGSFYWEVIETDPCSEGEVCVDGVCEEEVPEFPAGVTAVFGATLFIFLMMRRKYIEK